MTKIATYGPNDVWPRKAIIPDQTHGTKIVKLESGNEDLSECDGIWTERDEYILGVRHADCAPICFYNYKTIGIIHVGWRGLVNGIMEKMAEIFPPDGKNIAYTGPMIHCYEIKKDKCYEMITDKFGDKFIRAMYTGMKSKEYPDGEKYFFHFREAVLSMLEGYHAKHGHDSRDTYFKCDGSLAGHRRGDTPGKNNVMLITRQKSNLFR